MTLPLVKALHEWPHPESKPTPSPFGAGVSATEEMLIRELRAVRARYPLLSLVAGDRAIRQDGHLRSDAKILYRGVILSFEQAGVGPVSYACDRFTRSYRGSALDWQHNLRAVALGMESLRRVERYGIADAGQQYAGFKAIGAGIALSAAASAMTVDEAARLLVDHADFSDEAPTFDKGQLLERLLAEPTVFLTSVYRRAARGQHPDMGGDPALFRRLTEARDLLAAQP